MNGSSNEDGSNMNGNNMNGSHMNGSNDMNDTNDMNGSNMNDNHGQLDDYHQGSHQSFMARFRSSPLFRTWLKVLRVLQFLSAIISLGLFSSRIWKVIRLYHRIKTSDGAVEGILAAAVAYTIIATILQLLLRTGASKTLRWILILLDVLFVGAFIAVAKLTAPNGPSGPCRKAVGKAVQHPTEYNSGSCELPWGTFVLAIFSTILHALTAVFHEYREKHREHHREHTDKTEARREHKAGKMTWGEKRREHKAEKQGQGRRAY